MSTSLCQEDSKEITVDKVRSTREESLQKAYELEIQKFLIELINRPGNELFYDRALKVDRTKILIAAMSHVIENMEKSNGKKL